MRERLPLTVANERVPPLETYLVGEPKADQAETPNRQIDRDTEPDHLRSNSDYIARRITLMNAPARLLKFSGVPK